MTLGLSLSAFTTLHVAISLIAIAAGLMVVAQLLDGRHQRPWIGAFLASTALTSITGFMFPPTPQISPAQIFGGVSLVLLAIAAYSFYGRDLRGRERTAFVVTALLALYLNCFVAVVQSFQKIPALARIAPTQSELPFAAAQIALLIVFLAIGWASLRRPVPQMEI